jgi:hypothetical protein
MNISEFSVSTTITGRFKNGLIAHEAKLAPVEYRGPAYRSTRRIADDVLKLFYPSITFEEIVGHAKVRPLVIARCHIWYTITLRRPDISLAGIGRAFNRDHTTVLHGIRQHKKRIGLL